MGRVVGGLEVGVSVEAYFLESEFCCGGVAETAIFFGELSTLGCEVRETRVC
jgi:hypothetical protein